MFERLKGMIERNRQLREIEGMDARELGDMGLERDELSALIQTPAEVLARQSEMARKFDLEDSDFGPHRPFPRAPPPPPPPPPSPPRPPRPRPHPGPGPPAGGRAASGRPGGAARGGGAADGRRSLAARASTAEAAVFCPNAGLYSDLASDKTR